MDRRGTCRRLPDSARRCQPPRPAAHQQDTPRQSSMVPRQSVHRQENLRLCQTVSQTSVAHARDSQTVGDDAKTVLVPDRRDTSRRLPDGARNSPRPSGHLQETLRQSATMPRLSGHQPETLRQSPRPLGHLQETPRQYAMLQRTSGHLQ
ncbi:hypothetical protein DPMN_177849 [Dreissena polymorpha]|uniref:Uncharacterized protein n=1 Tax=Dreissena polymorpha TaxID=45954 RepID=A0A9D4E9H6_DREPO|nr:hypothetical protein DPMN_177849 [Dreissena polymorpha]